MKGVFQRRQLFVHPVQYWFVITTLLYFACLLLTLYAVVFLPMAQPLYDPSVSWEQHAQIASQFLELNARMWPWLIITFLVLLLHSMYFMHRIAGPLYRFLALFRSIGTGQLHQRAPGDREQCLTGGMNDYISKPFSMDHLRAVLTSWLSPNAVARKVERLTLHQRSPPISLPSVPASESELSSSWVVDQNAWTAITSLQKPGKEDTLAKILTLYLAGSQQLVDKLRGGMTIGDAMAVNQVAHSLKSRSAVLGALSLAKLCQQFETLSRRGQLKEVEPLLDQLDAAFDHASRMFRAELNKRRAA